MADTQTNRSLPTCKTCGSGFAPGGGNQWTKQKVYCSKACSDRAPKVGGEVRKCMGCATEFVKRRRSNDAGLYCSRACSVASKRAKLDATPVVIGPCSVCDRVWCRRESGVNRCSVECERTYRSEQSRLRYHREAVLQAGDVRCVECGEIVQVDSNANQRMYCGGKCLRRSNKRMRKHAEASGAQTEIIRFVDVYDKANGKCGICGLAVDRTAAPSTPLSPTIDHIWPVSLHGKHTSSNVQLAHFYCNTAKSNRMKLNEEQVVLLRMNVTGYVPGQPMAYPSSTTDG